MTKSKPKNGIEILSQTPVTASEFPRGVIRLAFRSNIDGAEDWALLWPPERGGHWCVVIHGYGSHGDQIFVREDIRRDWLQRFRDRGMGILAPNHRNNGWMGPRAAADLHALLGFVRREFGGKRFTFISGSMGGSCNLIYAVLYPRDVAAVVALCPVTDLGPFYSWRDANVPPASVAGSLADIRAQYDGSPAERPDIYRRHSPLKNAARLTMPLYLCHGDADAIVPVEESRALAAVCKNPRFRYRELPGGHHDSPLAPDIMDEALDWVLGPAGAGAKRGSKDARKTDL
jgi:pimeloyl-ACP methyl ester carboxylesterase